MLAKQHFVSFVRSLSILVLFFTRTSTEYVGIFSVCKLFVCICCFYPFSFASSMAGLHKYVLVRSSSGVQWKTFAFLYLFFSFFRIRFSLTLFKTFLRRVVSPFSPAYVCVSSRFLHAEQERRVAWFSSSFVCNLLCIKFRSVGIHAERFVLASFIRASLTHISLAYFSAAHSLFHAFWWWCWHDAHSLRNHWIRYIQWWACGSKIFTCTQSERKISWTEKATCSVEFTANQTWIFGG